MLTGTLCTLFLLCTSLFAGYSSPPDSLTETTFTSGAFLKAIVLDQDSRIDVAIEYNLYKEPGSTQLQYSGLKAFGTQINNIKAFFNLKEVELNPNTDQLKIAGRIDLPESLAKDSTVSFVLNYQLINPTLHTDHQFDIPIPLLWIENSYSISDKSIFNAHLVVPEGYYLNESFPGNAQPCYSNGDPRHNCVSLQVLPTFLRFRGSIGNNPALTPLKALDYGILFSLTIACIVVGIVVIKRQFEPTLGT